MSGRRLYGAAGAYGQPTRAHRSARKASALDRTETIRLGGAGNGASSVLALQRLAGNTAVVRAITAASEVVGHAEACGTDVNLECSASASRSRTDDKTVAPPRMATNKDDGTISFAATGKLKSTFTTTVAINLAQVPPGLSDCATAKFQKLIKKHLEPHEKDHKKRFTTTKKDKSYNGTFKTKVTGTGDDATSATDDTNQKLDEAAAAEETKRADRNTAYAVDAIDPFNVNADISDCPECTGPVDEGQQEESA